MGKNRKVFYIYATRAKRKLQKNEKRDARKEGCRKEAKRKKRAGTLAQNSKM